MGQFTFLTRLGKISTISLGTKTKKSDLKIFSGRANRPLAEKIARTAGIPLGRIDIRNFSDGEIWVKYSDNIRGDDVFIVQSTQPPAENLMELLILIDAARRASARVAHPAPRFAPNGIQATSGSVASLPFKAPSRETSGC